MALEDEGAQAADMADGTAQNPGSGGQSTSVTIDVSPLDSTLTDIDMDEIMRSFDFSQPVSSTHVDTSTGSHGQLGNTWGEHWQNMDPSLFLDPLFGFEASLPAFDLPSHEI
jgi:hypothetical protein